VECSSTSTLIMPRNYEAEARQKFVVPNPPSKDNYSPGGHVTAMEEWDGEREIMLSKRDMWIEKEKAADKVRELEL
jgi:hypothetical protein